MISLGLIFSNWIFVWFILYVLRVIPFNPTVAFVISIFMILFEIIMLLSYGTNQYNITKFIIINVLLKFIPLLIMWYISDLHISLKDFNFGLSLFIFYLVYLYLNDETFTSIYIKLLRPYIYDIKDPKQKTIYSNTYDYIYTKLVN
jgi:hypothetical protein